MGVWSGPTLDPITVRPGLLTRGGLAQKALGPHTVIRQKYLGDDPEPHRATGGNTALSTATGREDQDRFGTLTNRNSSAIANLEDNAPPSVNRLDRVRRDNQRPNKEAQAALHDIEAAISRSMQKTAIDPALLVPSAIGVGASMGIGGIRKWLQKRRLSKQLDATMGPAQLTPGAEGPPVHPAVLQHLAQVHHHQLLSGLGGVSQLDRSIEEMGPLEAAKQKAVTEGTSVAPYKASPREALFYGMKNPGIRTATKFAPFISGMLFPQHRLLNLASTGASLLGDVAPLLPKRVTGPSPQFQDWRQQLMAARANPLLQGYQAQMSSLQQMMGRPVVGSAPQLGAKQLQLPEKARA